MNTISHANHLGERRSATQPEPFNHDLLFHFPQPVAGQVFFSWDGYLYEPPAPKLNESHTVNGGKTEKRQTSDRKTTRADTQKARKLEKRINRFRPIMFNQPPMRDKQIADMLDLVYEPGAVPVSARSSLLLLVASGHVAKIGDRLNTKWVWIGD